MSDKKSQPSVSQPNAQKKCVDHNTCEFCGKSFSSAGNLRVHINTAKYCLSIREENGKGYTCDYCEHKLTRRSALTSHQKICIKYKDHIIETKDEEIDVLTKDNAGHLKIIKSMQVDSKNKTKIHQLDAATIKNLTTENEGLKAKIAELEKTVSYSKGYVEGYKTVKPPKQITNNNIVQKLKDLPVTTIPPLTITLIKSNLENYTYEMYKLAELGVVQFMKGLTILEMDDGTIEKNYVSSDRSRNAFHRLVVGKEWKSDAGAKFLNTILDQIIPKVKEHDKKLTEKASGLGTRDATKDILLKIQTNLLPFYLGVTEEKSKDRVAVLMKIRNAIKDINHIDGLSIKGS